MKDKKLHHVLSHSNYATKEILLKYKDTLEKAKDIAKVNQVTDLLIAIRNQPELAGIVMEGANIVWNDIKNHTDILYTE